MLSKIRKNMRTFSLPLWLVAGSFVGTIFLVWGKGSVSNPSSTQVAVVNGYPIGLSEFYREVNRIAKEYESSYGDKFRKFVDEHQIKMQALNRLIIRKLLESQVEKEKIRISDWAVARYLRSLDYFAVNGTFSEKLYKEFLKLNHLTPGAFEDMLRKDLEVDKLQSALYSTAVVVDRELRYLYKYNFGKRKFLYKLFLSSDFSPDVSSDEMRDYYEKHKEEFVYSGRENLRAVKVPKSDNNSSEVVRKLFDLVKQGKIESMDGYLVFSPIGSLKTRMESVLNETSKNYGFLDYGGSYYVFLKSAEKRIKPFEKVKLAIKMKLRRQKSLDMARELATRAASSGKSLDKSTGYVSKDGLMDLLKFDNEQDLDYVFRARTGMVVGPFKVMDGFAVVKPVTDLSVDNVDRKRMESLREFLGEIKREAAIEAYIGFLRNRARIKLNKDLLR